MITNDTQRAVSRAVARGVPARVAARKIGTRWVKVSGLYVSRGMTGWFTMDKGRDTYAQVAYAYTGDAWNLGGMASEESSRGWSGTTAHHKGPWRHVIQANYNIVRSKITKHICDPGNCWTYTVGHRDQLGGWRGSLRHMHGPAGQPKWSRIKANRILLGRGQSYVKHTEKNHTYSAGFTIHGLGVNTRAGYSGVTEVHWHIRHNCRKNWLAALNAAPAQAAGNVYARSRKC